MAECSECAQVVLRSDRRPANAGQLCDAGSWRAALESQSQLLSLGTGLCLVWWRPAGGRRRLSAAVGGSGEGEAPVEDGGSESDRFL